MPTCTFCGEDTRNYVGYNVDGVFCSEEHSEYEAMRLGKGSRNLTTEELATRTGQSNAGYTWQPRAIDDAHRIVVASETDCAYCGQKPHGYIGWFENRVYCSEKHMKYDYQKRQGDSTSEAGGGRHANETDCREGASHAGYTWQP